MLGDKNTPYNRRQYQLMLDLIKNFDCNASSYGEFGQVVENLSALIDVLEDVPENIVDELWSIWGSLEEIYADHENAGVMELSQEERNLISKILDAFKVRVEEAKKGDGGVKV